MSAPNRSASLPPASPEIVVCMATHDPPPELFAAQVESIRAQTRGRWICQISDDASDAAHYREIERVIADDERFILARSDRRLGFYRNFERALAAVPTGATYVALADQDDRWHADKLEALAGAIDGALLAYADARIVGPDGAPLAATFWTRRRPNRGDLAALLIANAVSGSTALYSRSVLDDALPFPDLPGTPYHDHWLALVALALGEIAYVPRPLSDYVQHDRAALGHAAAQGAELPPVRERAARIARPRRLLAAWRELAAEEYDRSQALAEALRDRCGERMAPAKRRALERFLGCADSFAGTAWLAARALRPAAGSETGGFERALLRAAIARRLDRSRLRDD